jgi:hypothetical protein
LWNGRKREEEQTGEKVDKNGMAQPFKYEAQTALFKDPVRTAQ